MELFKLFGTIAVNNADANSAIDDTSDKAESFSSKLSDGIGKAAKWGTAIVGGATAAGSALVAFASKSASTADNIDKMSQKIGISRQAYQELDFICSQSGTSVDNLQAGMKSLVSAMDGAASGTASNVEQFEKLGVSVTNADGSLRSSEEISEGFTSIGSKGFLNFGKVVSVTIPNTITTIDSIRKNTIT